MASSTQQTWWAFVCRALRSPRLVGAVAPSSQRLVKAMLDQVPLADASVVVEFGPGTGVFTTEIIRRMRADARLFVFELDPVFAKNLDMRLSDPRVRIINASAAQSQEYLARFDALPVDCIVSGLPFTSLPRPVTHAILQTTTAILKFGGLFVTYQYTPLLRHVLHSYFPRSYIARFVLRNLPPALVFVCPNLP